LDVQTVEEPLYILLIQLGKPLGTDDLDELVTFLSLQHLGFTSRKTFRHDRGSDWINRKAMASSGSLLKIDGSEDVKVILSNQKYRLAY